MGAVSVRLTEDGRSEITVLGEDAADASKTLIELRKAGAFSAVKTIAEEYKNAPLASVEPTEAEAKAGLDMLMAALPGSELIADLAPSESYDMRSPEPVQVSQSTPPCGTCGQPTTHGKGNHPQSGPWEAYFCSSGIRDHTHFIKR